MFRYFATAFLTLTLVSTVAFADTPNNTTNSTGNAVTVEGTNTGNTNTTTTDGTTTNTTGTAIPATGTTGTTGTATTVPNTAGTTPATAPTSLGVDADKADELAKKSLGEKDEMELISELIALFSSGEKKTPTTILLIVCLILMIVIKGIIRFVPKPFTWMAEKAGTKKIIPVVIVISVTLISAISTVVMEGGLSWAVLTNSLAVAFGSTGLDQFLKGVTQTVSKENFLPTEKEEAAEATSE